MFEDDDENALVVVAPAEDVMHLRLTHHANHVLAYRDGAAAIIDNNPDRLIWSGHNGWITGFISDTGTPFKLETADEYVRAAVRQGIPIYDGDDPKHAHAKLGQHKRIETSNG